MKIKQIMVMFIGALLGVQLLTGCASHSKTYKETTTVTDTASTAAPASQTTTTVTTSDSTRPSSSGGSILGGIFHVIGEVIAFPFKVIGAALDAIF